jgi:hypothetical protein
MLRKNFWVELRGFGPLTPSMRIFRLQSNASLFMELTGDKLQARSLFLVSARFIWYRSVSLGRATSVQRMILAGRVLPWVRRTSGRARTGSRGTRRCMRTRVASAVRPGRSPPRPRPTVPGRTPRRRCGRAGGPPWCAASRTSNAMCGTSGSRTTGWSCGLGRATATTWRSGSSPGSGTCG